MTEDDGMRMHLRDVLAQIEDANGRLTPEAVVGAASDPDHPLHDRFDWDDATAAHTARIMTARRLIASVTVRVRHRPITLAAPAYIRDPMPLLELKVIVLLFSYATTRWTPERLSWQKWSVSVRFYGGTRALCVALEREADITTLEMEVEQFIDSLGSESEEPPRNPS